MRLTTAQRVQIDRLLLAREERLVRVYAIETEIGRILGQPYPFPLPPETLPSQRTGNRRKSK
ncbi:MAG: hypothetical protein JJT96_19370 [Opitutales bacterium]|nr:hypothetical protein [Opitutales bacterium]